MDEKLTMEIVKNDDFSLPQEQTKDETQVTPIQEVKPEPKRPSETEIEEVELVKLSAGARASVDERLLYSYDRIRKNYRNGLSVVPVERDSCGGCYNAIPPQRQSEIRLHKKIVVCENCGRILIDSDLNDSVEVK
jgi:predicted  nucleic acid-binding Zn-ribbon protein